MNEPAAESLRTAAATGQASTAKLVARVRFGGDYYPEQWPRTVWQDDVRLMSEAGVNLVTVGVFAWAMLEPSEGRFDFGWLREVLDLLGEAGIGVDLATPTAAPPPWLLMHYPGARPVNEHGAPYWHGSRQHFCVCSADYRRLALRIVDRLAEAVGSHEAIELWHVHNEYACQVPYCYCDNHAAQFRAWLQQRYGSVEALNEAWGTTFWSQRYTDYSEVIPPRQTPTLVNPTQQLDYRRFSSDAFLEEFRAERGILKRAWPEIPATTNFMGLYKPLDYFGWARELDVVSTDNYQDPSDPEYPIYSALHCDLVRSLNKTAPWMVMEQAVTRVNWRQHNVAKTPGQMRALSHQAVARGARGIMFFQWRASRYGAEKFHSALVGHSGRLAEGVADLSRELAARDVGHARVSAPVAICFSWPSWWAMEGAGMPATGLQMPDQLYWAYRPLYRIGITADFCQPDDDLSQYRTVVLPCLYMVSTPAGQNVSRYVRNGGTAVISFWSGIVDERDHVYLGPYGGPLRDLFGGDVVDIAPIPHPDPVTVEWTDGTTSTATLWSDVIDVTDGDVLARLTSGPHAGRPTVIRARRGEGTVYYVGARLDDAGTGHLYSLTPAASQGASLPPDVERVLRTDGKSAFEFLINHSGTPCEVETRPGGLDQVTGQRVDGGITLPAHGITVITRPHRASA